MDSTANDSIGPSPEPTIPWRPHASRELDDSEEPNVGGSPARGDRAEPNVYRFEVWWDVSSDEEPDEQLPDPIETAPFVLEP